MTLCIILTSLSFLSIVTFAQNVTSDSPENRTGSAAFIQVEDHHLHSMQLSFTDRTDSLKLAYNRILADADAALQPLTSEFDSIKIRSNALKSALSLEIVDSLQSRWKNTMDTLFLLDERMRQLSAAVDSLNNLRERVLIDLDTRFQSLKDKTLTKLKALHLPPQLSDKATELSRKVKIADISAADLKIPGPGAISLNLQSPVSSLSIEKVKALIGMEDKMNALSSVTDKASAYANDLHQLENGDLSVLDGLSQAAELEVQKVAGLENIKEQTEVFGEYKSLAQQFQHPDSLKVLASEKAQQVAVTHFSGREEQLTQAMATLAKFKSRYPNVQDIGDVVKRPVNEMKNKTLIERLVFGVGVQVQKKGDGLVADINPYAAYKFTGRLSAGVGWNQHLAMRLYMGQLNTFVKRYGPRMFGEYKLCEGLALRGEVEMMYARGVSSSRGQTPDPLSREWMWGVLAGIKKDYKLFREVKGTAIIRMRIYDTSMTSLYREVVNIRLGVEFPLKKKEK